MKTNDFPWVKFLLIQIVFALATFAGIWWALKFHANAPKIGYVDTSRLLSEFTEAKRNKSTIDSLNKDWQSKAKTLRDSLDAYAVTMGTKFNSVDKQSQLEMRAEIERKNQELAQFVKASQAKVLDRERALLEPTLKKINDCMQELSKREKFDLIFGSTNNGSIMAGGIRLDLTLQVVRELNQKYP